MRTEKESGAMRPRAKDAQSYQGLNEAGRTLI